MQGQRERTHHLAEQSHARASLSTSSRNRPSALGDQKLPCLPRSGVAQKLLCSARATSPRRAARVQQGRGGAPAPHAAPSACAAATARAGSRRRQKEMGPRRASASPRASSRSAPRNAAAAGRGGPLRAVRRKGRRGTDCGGRREEAIMGNGERRQRRQGMCQGRGRRMNLN